MSEPKTRPTDASVGDFLAQQPPERQADCRGIARLMEQATGEPPVLWGPSIVGFGRYPITNSAGKTSEWPLIGFSPRKNDLTLYLVPGFDNLLAKLGKHKTSKACLYIKKLDDVDVDVLKQLIAASVKAMAPKRIR